MKRNTKQTFIKIAHLCEILLSIVILLVILLGIFDILREVYGAYIVDFANPVNYEQLNNSPALDDFGIKSNFLAIA